MVTKKPVETILICSETQLQMILKDLFKYRVIKDFQYVCHKPDVNCHKDHIHLLIYPKYRLDLRFFDDILHTRLTWHKCSDFYQWINRLDFCYEFPKIIHSPNSFIARDLDGGFIYGYSETYSHNFI